MENETVSKNFIENIIDKDLEEGVYDTVHTRFPPEPNGYLHIGHAKSILLNYGLAQKYNGKFNLRFDDTNPTKEKSEFVESIKADVKWLGADWEDRLFFASDYFDQMYEAAVKLIKKGKAFVCDLTADQIREYRGTLTEPGKESPYRNRTVEENLQLFEEMRGYTSAKYLSEHITDFGFKKTKQSILHYIELAKSLGILEPTENSLKPYKIVKSKEEITVLVKDYLPDTSDISAETTAKQLSDEYLHCNTGDRWNAGNGI